MVVDLRHGAGRRPQHRAAFLPVGFLTQTRDQAVPEFCRAPKHRRFLPSRHHHGGEIAEGRRVLHPAQLNLQIVKSVVILLRRVPDDLMVGHHRLNNGLSGAVPPAGSAHHLGEHIEGGLPRQIPAGVQAQIGVQHAHQRDVGEVQPLGHHLGAKKHGNVLLLEVFQNFFMCIHGAYRVGVHPVGLHVGKEEFQLLLHLLGAGADGFQRSAAFRAALRHRLGKAAVVAHQPVVGAVIGQADAAPGTFRRFPAVHTHQRPAVSPAVEQQNRLLSRVPVVGQRFPQRDAQGKIVSQLQLLPHVHDVHGGQLPSAIAFRHSVQAVSAGLRPVHTFHGGRRGAEQHQCAFLRAPPDGDLFGAVAGGIFGFIGMLLFLVQNDQAGGTGGKHRRAGPYDHFRVAASDALPLVVPFPRPKAAVQHRHLSAEIGRHQPQQLGRQGDFRHQKQGASARFQTGLDEFDIDGSLSRAGHTPKERDARIFLRHLLRESVIAALLIGAEHQRPVQLCRTDFPASKDRLLGQRQIPQFFQPVHRRGRSAGKIAQLLHGHAAHAAHQLQHIFLHGGGFGTVGGVLHGFLGGNRQSGDFLRLVIGAAQIFRFGGYPLFPRKIRDHAGKGFLVGNQSAQSRFLRLTAQIFQQRKHLRRAVLTDGLFLP